MEFSESPIIKEMTCKCGINVRYNINSNVSFVDAYRTIKEKCTCEELE